MVYQNHSGFQKRNFNTGEETTLLKLQEDYRYVQKIAVAKSGSFFIIADAKGLIKIDTETNEVYYLVKESDLYNEIDVEKWGSFSFHVNTPIISSDESKVYFTLTIELSANCDD
jgi:hypothetical protein